MQWLMSTAFSMTYCMVNKTDLQPVSRLVNKVHYFGGCKIPLVPRLCRQTTIRTGLVGAPDSPNAFKGVRGGGVPNPVTSPVFHR